MRAQESDIERRYRKGPPSLEDRRGELVGTLRVAATDRAAPMKGGSP